MGDTSRPYESLGYLQLTRKGADLFGFISIVDADLGKLFGEELIAELAKRGIIAGYDLSNDYPELGNALLVCATETRTAADIKAYADALAETLKAAVRAA
jgi:glycine dehydrogenase subunit 1